ncbi:hypothetical protein DCAR_0313929 [Daucus carota subsp. sativus]|uniref:Knotted 1-binding protein 36 n=1 Tax=Daucus carota subsp. sativus TaxID=79200 RepID=A0A161WXT0_DAUCS|nr:PREDICTED: uncharacterized protein LOC108214068 [Daucus carota subsp. sativus]XP_017241342.1 PREDICTED: uncharacterized protein LOC108214068 [Daucus carota subsp. sativus]WOG94633.1 hypothetical protein DCAR_0313929 [Daucus carota subsp. sativus]
MEGEEADVGRKRMRQSVENEQIIATDAEETVGEETEDGAPLSEQMQLDIASIHEKINSFTTLVSELMESGKSLLLERSNQFEERLISIHKEQTEKWEQEIRELRLLDAANEEANSLLHDARYLLQNVHIDS